MEVKCIAKQAKHLTLLEESFCLSSEKINTGLNQNKGLLGRIKGEQLKY